MTTARREAEKLKRSELALAHAELLVQQDAPSQREKEAFGDVCGIDRSYMGGIERGEHNLALMNILKIIAALEMQPSEFFRAMDRPGRA